MGEPLWWAYPKGGRHSESQSCINPSPKVRVELIVSSQDYGKGGGIFIPMITLQLMAPSLLQTKARDSPLALKKPPHCERAM